jgi:ATP-binding cassette subfamily B (MDR/TAP) protein 1
LRSQFGVVSQEPVLFNTSFKENIKYNMAATQEQIIQVSKQSNAYGFIMENE